MVTSHCARCQLSNDVKHALFWTNEITELPRKKQKVKKRKVKQRVSYPQKCCECSTCAELCVAFDRTDHPSHLWRAEQELAFKQMNHDQQVPLMGTLLKFRTPHNRSCAKAWREGGQRKTNYPKTYQIVIHGPNGLDEFLICHKFLKFIFAFGALKQRKLLEAVWINRQKHQALMHDPQQHESYKNVEHEPEWLSIFNN